MGHSNYKGKLTKQLFDDHIQPILSTEEENGHHYLIPKLFFVDGLNHREILEHVAHFPYAPTTYGGINSRLINIYNKIESYLNSITHNRPSRETIFKLFEAHTQKYGIVHSVSKLKPAELHAIRVNKPKDHIVHQLLKLHERSSKNIDLKTYHLYQIRFSLFHILKELDYRDYNKISASNENTGHRILKYLAYNILMHIGLTNISTEGALILKKRKIRADLFSGNTGLIVECGINNVVKLTTLLENLSEYSILFIPFQHGINRENTEDYYWKGRSHSKVLNTEIMPKMLTGYLVKSGD